MKYFKTLFILLILSFFVLGYTVGFHKAYEQRLSKFIKENNFKIGMLNSKDFNILVKNKDFEGIKKIMQYCHNYGVEQKITDNCGEMAVELSIMAQRNGFTAQAVPIGGHWGTEIFSKQHKKMVFLDPYFNAYYTTLDGIPLSLLYLYAKFHKPDGAYYLRHILYENNQPKYKTFDEALNAIKAYYIENGIVMVENINEKRRKRYGELYERSAGYLLDLTPSAFCINLD